MFLKVKKKFSSSHELTKIASWEIKIEWYKIYLGNADVFFTNCEIVFGFRRYNSIQLAVIDS